MDIEKQAADLRCCGNCQNSGFSVDMNGSPVFSCFQSALVNGLACKTLANPRCVCPYWESDAVDDGWRLKQQEYLLRIEP